MVLHHLLLIAATLALSCISIVQANNPSWTIYHSWNGGQDYSRRGVLQWNGDELIVENDGDVTQAQMESMLQSGWYHVKIDTVDGDYVLATVPACNIRRANFRDEFSITLPRVGDPQSMLSLAYTPLVSPLAPKSCHDLDISETNQWNSRAQVALETPGMTIQNVLPHTKPPPGLTFLKNPNTAVNKKTGQPQQGPGGATGEEEPSQPFYRKYWYVFLPLALANLLPAAQEPPTAGEQQQGGGQSQQGGAAPQPIAAAPAPRGSAASKRRGKRG